MAWINGKAMAGTYTAERTKPKTRALVVNLLAQGEPICRIEQQADLSRPTIIAIREQEYGEKVKRKELIRAQAAQVATEAFDQLHQHLLNGNLNANQLVPIAGMAADKVQLLSPPDTQTLNINHTIEPGPNLYAKLQGIAERLQPKVIEATVIEDTQSPNSPET